MATNYNIILKTLKKDLLGNYGRAAEYCNVSKATVSRQLNSVYIDSALIEKLVEFRNILLAERQDHINKLTNKIKVA